MISTIKETKKGGKVNVLPASKKVVEKSFSEYVAFKIRFKKNK